MGDTNNQPTPAERVEQIAQGFAAIADNQSSLAQDLATIKDRTNEDAAQRHQNARTLRIMKGLLIAKLITLVLLGIVLLQVQHQNRQLTDCLTPNGKCAQRQAAITAAILGENPHRNEVERLQTEIAVAEAKGDGQAIAIRQQRLDQERTLLREYDDVIAKLEKGQVVELPTDTNANGS